MTGEAYAHYATGRTHALIKQRQSEFEALWPLSPKQQEVFFMRLAAQLSYQNVNVDGKGTLRFENIEGGPFASVIVRPSQAEKPPQIVGMGANHVLPENDPSAHGEIVALRDAAARLGYSDLSGMVLYSSAECCPQCQAALAGAGIARVVYANDRHQTAQVGFSDAQQYQHLLRLHQAMQPLAAHPRAEAFRAALGMHGAVILDGQGEVVATGDAMLFAQDPSASLPSMNAIRAACRARGHFHLPEDFTLVSLRMLHPAAFTTADWARLGRLRDRAHQGDPQRDRFEKDASKLLYVLPEWEQMQVVDSAGGVRIVADAEAIIRDLKMALDARRVVATSRCTDATVLAESLRAFEHWSSLTLAHQHLKY